MKFGLLVVLAVAVLVPSLSEGRTVSRCELRQKLGQAITLPPRLQKFKQQYLAIVICELNSRSRLNTGLVKVFGKRRTTTTAKPTTMVITQPTTTQPTTTQSTTTEPTTTQPTTTAPTTTQPIPTGTNRTGAGNNRRKREASSEESDSVEMDLRLEELLNWHNETADEDEAEKGGERKKRSSKDRSSEETKQSSFGLYGIFQLSDETFCNSGYRSSKNKCNTACNAFTDDNIMDDIDCFVKTDQWGLFLKSASRECRYRTKNFFDECK
ncbi:uncharacterized protein LOC118494861 [Sander lucioperca]|uniref:uncharacterized protein LOC118494861 n=1 Tax=Sander lucioperca TaxID=283035 RepID=UPI001653B217|nr:uncharacterized protein LOC118494861 [Sander lucioperca]